MTHSSRDGEALDRRGLFRKAGGLAAAAAAAALPLPGRAAAGPAGNAPVAADATHAVILLYHRFAATGHSATSVTSAQLDAQIALLRSGRYTVLPVPEILDAVRDGRTLPDRTVGITVGDGARSFANTAWPRFQAAGLPVTLFATGTADARPGTIYAGWQALRRLAADGVTIGNHGLNHRPLPNLAPAEARQQILAAQAQLQEQLGAAPRLFAYPYGEWTPAVRALVAEAGFAAAFGQQSGVLWPGSDRLALPRYPLNAHYGKLDRFRLLCDALPLPMTAILPGDPQVTAENPPRLQFTVAPGVAGLDRISCFVSGRRDPVPLQRIGPRRFAVRLPDAFPPGRTRVNCTLPVRDPDGTPRWRWFGMQFQVAKPAA